jgi:hypothetical protein
LDSIARASELDRAAEIYALGSLYTPTALAALREIGLTHAPPDIDQGHERDGTEWYKGQIYALRWIHAAARSLTEDESHVESLLAIVSGGDQFSKETAADALLSLDPSVEMRTRLQNALSPEDQYILDLTFE